MIDTRERSECIALACVVALGLEEGGDQLRSIGDEGFRVLEDGGHSEYSVLADVCVAMLEAGSGRGEEGLNELGFAELA